MNVPLRSERLSLTLLESSNIPIEVDGITPDRIEKLSELEVAKLPIYHGNRREELGQFFAVAGDPSQGCIQFLGDTHRVKLVGARMAAGTVFVEKGVGSHAGAQMTGGQLFIDEDAGDWLGAEMRGGHIEVRHEAGNQVGAAYRGSRRGMTGGVILCRDRAGDEVGLLMRRGLIVIEGECGEFAGTSMIAGTILALGKVGRRLGAGMKRGTIVAAAGIDELPPSFRYSCRYRPTALDLYLRALSKWEVSIPDELRTGTVACYRGDHLHHGRGEILVGGKSKVVAFPDRKATNTSGRSV